MKLALILWCVILCGCGRRPAANRGLTFYVGTECHPTARVTGCDQNTPPKCKEIDLKYDKACEQLVVK
jgi:hypothetical protein